MLSCYYDLYFNPSLFYVCLFFICFFNCWICKVKPKPKCLFRHEASERGFNASIPHSFENHNMSFFLQNTNAESWCRQICRLQ